MSPTTELGWAWMPLAPTWLLALAAVVAVAALALGVWRTPGPAHRRALSGGLRLLAVAALLVLLLGPSRTEEQSHAVRHRVVLLLDDSASMGVRDGEGTRAERAVTFSRRQLAEAAGVADDVEIELRLLRDPGAAVDGATLAAEVAAGGAHTDYLTALEALAEDLPPAAVVLVGDGADRATLGRVYAGEGAAGVEAALAELPFPVHTVAVGGAIEQDLQLKLGPTPPFAFLRRPFDLPVEVVAVGLGGEVPVTLRLDGDVLASRTATLPRGGGRAEVVFHVTPEETGYLTLEAAGPVPAEDPLPHNNGDACTLRVIRDRTRVLQLAGSPSWDVRFLRRFLKGDPNIDLVSFFIMRTGPLHGRYRASPLSLIEFPHEELFVEDLPGFDLVVLQNFTFDSFPARGRDTDRYTENLAAFVEEGGALLILGGDRSFAEGGLAGSPLTRVLPLTLDRGAGVADATASPTPTEAGLRHPVTRLGPDAEAAAEAWAQMPSIQGWNRVAGAADGAAVLVTAGEGGDPLIAVREVQRGRVMAVTTDDTWRWGREAGAGGFQYRTFWRGALRWLLREEAQGRVALRVDRETVPAGAPARLSLRVLGEDYAPEAGAAVTVTVEPLQGGDGATEHTGITDEGGSWSLDLPAPLPGSYRALAAVAGRVDGDEVRFTVRAEREELRDPSARPELMADVARATGGRRLAAEDDLGGVLRDLGPGTRIRRSTATPAWDRWWWLLAVALPLAAEWLLRRRWGAP